MASNPTIKNIWVIVLRTLEVKALDKWDHNIGQAPTVAVQLLCEDEGFLLMQVLLPPSAFPDKPHRNGYLMWIPVETIAQPSLILLAKHMYVRVYMYTHIHTLYIFHIHMPLVHELIS